MFNAALVTDSPNVSLWLLQHVARDLQTQMRRDVMPAWALPDVTVTAFADPNNLPSGAWKILISDDIGEPGALGVHQDANGLPYALVQTGPNWSATASHELIEMLIDPLGKRVFRAPSLIATQGMVEYLAEPGDPVELKGYTITDFRVSNFVLPRFYAGGAGPYDQRRVVREPLTLLEGGYISWRLVGTNHWFQAFMSGGRLHFNDFGTLMSQTGKRWSEILDGLL